MSRPERRKSALAQQSPIQTQEPSPPPTVEQAPPSPKPAPSASPQPQQVDRTRPTPTPPVTKGKATAASGRRVRVGPYVAEDEAARIRAAYQFGYLRTSTGSFTDFLAETILDRVRQLENEHNGGVPFAGIPKGITKSLSQMAVEERKRNRQ